MTYLKAHEMIRFVPSGRSKKLVEINGLIIVSAGMYTNGCFMTEEQEKVTGWTIDMHLVIDEQGKVKVTQDLLDALRVKQGDMLSFHIDTTTDMVTVTGSKKPPDFHPELQVQMTPITRGTPTDLSSMPGERATPKTPVIPNSPTPVPGSSDVTQPALFDAGQQKPPTSHRSRPQK